MLSFRAPGEPVASVTGSKGLFATARVSLSFGGSSLLLLEGLAEMLNMLMRTTQEAKDSLMNF